MLSSHIKFSLHLHLYLARCLANLLGPWDLGAVRHLLFASLFPLAIVHLVLVLGWVVLLVVPSVPGVRLEDAGTLVTFSLFSSLGHFLFLAASCLGQRIMIVFAFSCFALLACTGCLAFVFFSGLFCFIFLIPGRALAHVHSRTLARVHTLPLACGRACSCMPAWVLPWASPFWCPRSFFPPLSL